MIEFFHSLLVKPMEIAGAWRLGMLAPLALSISVVYKTIHCDRLAAVPLASLRLTLTILLGMMAIGAALLIVFHLLA